MLPILNNQEMKMTSKEISELVNKRHDSVRRTITTLVEKGVISNPQFVFGEKSANGVREHVFLFVGEQGRRDSIIVVAQLSPEFTAVIVDRWQELENRINPMPQIPQTYSEALRLAADQAEKIQEQQLLIEQQKPAVQFVEKYVEASSTKSLREAAKVLGVKERDFIAMLEDNNILFRQGGTLLPYAEHQHAKRFEVKTGEKGGFAFHQTRFTPSGLAWIVKRLSLD